MIRALTRQNLLRSFAPARGVRLPHGRKPFSAAAAATGESVPEEADVVIVGGGSLGVSTLYHLQKIGVNAVLVEKDKLTAGTTWHSAGLLWRLRPNDVDIQILGHSRDMAMNLEAETGVSTGWVGNGGLFIASNKERLDEYKRMATLGKYFDIDSQVLTPAETKELYPLMNMDDTPLEAGLGFASKLKTDIPFLGREALEAQKRDGLKKKIACFTMDDKVHLLGLETIWRDGACVGYLRRGDFGHHLGKSIGYGYVVDPNGGVVNNAFLKGGQYEIEVFGKKHPATLHIKPPFDPKNERIKGIYD